jgi:nitrate reductase alpha subunit
MMLSNLNKYIPSAQCSYCYCHINQVHEKYNNQDIANQISKITHSPNYSGDKQNQIRYKLNNL